MMRGELTFKGRTYKQVLVTGVTPDTDVHTDASVLHVALDAANEQRSSIWGWTAARGETDPSRVVVTLHTD